eukprot:15814468-Heterocapsa_arctica.AAC.1
MGRFRSRFYMCSASASRWGLGSGFDVASEKCRKFASEINIPCWAGVELWDDMEQVTTPDCKYHHGQRT